MLYRGTSYQTLQLPLKKLEYLSPRTFCFRRARLIHWTTIVSTPNHHHWTVTTLLNPSFSPVFLLQAGVGVLRAEQGWDPLFQAGSHSSAQLLPHCWEQTGTQTLAVQVQWNSEKHRNSLSSIELWKKIILLWAQCMYASWMYILKEKDIYFFNGM